MLVNLITLILCGTGEMSSEEVTEAEGYQSCRCWRHRRGESSVPYSPEISPSVLFSVHSAGCFFFTCQQDYL